jgi:hypothetical protein
VKDSKADYETRVTKLTVAPKGKPIFDESATDIYLEDEAGGEFVIVEQYNEGYGKVAIDVYEWPTIRAAIKKMIAKSRGAS